MKFIKLITAIFFSVLFFNNSFALIALPSGECTGRILTAAITVQIVCDDNGLPDKVWLSARANSGIELLHKAIATRLAGTLVDVTIRLAADLAKLRSSIYEMGFVKSERVDETGASCLEICLPLLEFDKLLKQGVKRVAIPELVSEDGKHLSVEPEIKSA